MEEITLKNFFQQTGRRFRPSPEQRQLIEAGQLTREQAFDDFLKNGGLNNTPSKRSVVIPEEIFQDPTLTLDNFSERVLAATGQKTRFRVSREQQVRVAANQLTREQAFAEFVAAKLNGVTINE